MVTDLTYLKKMTDGDPKVIKEMIDLFTGQIKEYIEQMNKYHKAGEWDSLANVAHKAKSSVAIMGMNDLANTLKELELLALEAKEVDKYQGYLDDFVSTCNIAMKELNDFYEQHN